MDDLDLLLTENEKMLIIEKMKQIELFIKNNEMNLSEICEMFQSKISPKITLIISLLIKGVIK